MIYINPNTNKEYQENEIEVCPDYFGACKDGIKFNDDEVIQPIDMIEVKHDTNQNKIEVHGENTGKDSRGRFTKGNNFGKLQVGIPKKNPLTERIKELVDRKYYDTKDGDKIRALDRLAEMVVDRAIVNKDLKAFEIIMDRIEGKVTQGIKHSGAVGHATPSQEQIEKIEKLFPNL